MGLVALPLAVDWNAWLTPSPSLVLLGWPKLCCILGRFWGKENHHLHCHYIGQKRHRTSAYLWGRIHLSRIPVREFINSFQRVWMQWRVKTCFHFSPVGFLKISFRQSCTGDLSNVIILFCWLQPPAPHVGTMAAAVPALTFKSSGKEQPIRSLPAFSLIG